MKSKTKEILKELESYIKEKSYKLSFFKGYTAVNKSGVVKFIDTIYKNLPQDIKNARDYLKSIQEYDLSTFNNKETIYDNLNNFENELENGFSIAKYTIVNIQKIENLLYKIYQSIPKEITKAENLSK